MEGHKGLLQLNTKYLTQNYQEDELLLKKIWFSHKQGLWLYIFFFFMWTAIEIHTCKEGLDV